MSDLDPADIPELAGDLATVHDTPEIQEHRITLHRLRQLKTERVWDWACATIDNQQNPNPANALQVGVTRTKVINLRDRIETVKQNLRDRLAELPAQP